MNHLSLLTATNISVTFGTKKVLEDVNLTVHRGEIVTLIGPNGAGKSTLVRTVLGLIQPTRGVVILEKGIHVGYMPQKLTIEPYLPLSVDRFLHLAGGVHLNPSEIQKVLLEVGAVHVLNEPIQNISGGELQRVLLARALLRSPLLLVLDEPVQGVDVTGQEELYRLIMQIRDQRQCGVLMVSHDLHVVMAGTDQVICLNNHVCCQGRPEAVSRNPEFLNLFGLSAPMGFAVYAHDHNHPHDHRHELPYPHPHDTHARHDKHDMKEDE